MSGTSFPVWSLRLWPARSSRYPPNCSTGSAHRLGAGAQRLGHPGEQFRLRLRHRADRTWRALSPGAADQQDVADRSPQILDQAASSGPSPSGATIASAIPSKPMRRACEALFRDLDAVAAPLQQSCEAGALRHVPTDDHDPAAHPGHPRTRQHMATIPNAAALLPAGYPPVIRQWHLARTIARRL